MTLLLILERHLLWSSRNPDGGITSYYVSNAAIWTTLAALLALLIYLMVQLYLRRRARYRRRRRTPRVPGRVIRAKNELSAHYLRPGFSSNIHAIGIGRLQDAYCIHVFVSDANQEWANGVGATPLPPSFRGFQLVMIEMPMAVFLSDSVAPQVSLKKIRERQEVILGGLSGANTNLTGECGTIGYFCTRKSKLPRRKEVLLLSNSHVFVDLRRSSVDDSDLIMQPSPAETASNRPIGSLLKFSPLKFADMDHPNHVDAAIARLWTKCTHRPVIPCVGTIKRVVKRKDVMLGEPVQKFGRTTGHTWGEVFSIYLDIWVHYDRAGQSAFFKDQFLLAPRLPEFTKFAAKGDSGSLCVDGEQNAVGLVFAGMCDTQPNSNNSANAVQRIENYGVANAISEVMDRLKLELLLTR